MNTNAETHEKQDPENNWNDKNDVEIWEERFSEKGAWEQNRGRDQTRIFCENFVKRIKIDQLGKFSLLDVGCALGDSIRHFSKVFPNAVLYGIDFSSKAIERCENDLKGVASFSVSDIDSVSGYYDIIYCSNILEHIVDYEHKARKLASHCSRLCIMTPYKEMNRKDGKPFFPDPTNLHQHTFYLNSFDFLVKEGTASHIAKDVFSCPGAFGGWSLKRKIETGIKNIFRPLYGKPLKREPKQILYDIFIR